MWPIKFIIWSQFSLTWGAGSMNIYRKVSVIKAR